MPAGSPGPGTARTRSWVRSYDPPSRARLLSRPRPRPRDEPPAGRRESRGGGNREPTQVLGLRRGHETKGTVRLRRRSRSRSLGREAPCLSPQEHPFPCQPRTPRRHTPTNCRGISQVHRTAPKLSHRWMRNAGARQSSRASPSPRGALGRGPVGREGDLVTWDWKVLTKAGPLALPSSRPTEPRASLLPTRSTRPCLALPDRFGSLMFCCALRTAIQSEPRGLRPRT